MIELALAPEDFPLQGDKITMNRYLEKWFNPIAEGEPLQLVSYSRWRNDLPSVTQRSSINREDVRGHFPQAVREKVIREIARLSHRPTDAIKPEMCLTTDLSLDSLDLINLMAVLDKEGKHEQQLFASYQMDLLTVAEVMAIVSEEHLPPTDESHPTWLRRWQNVAKHTPIDTTALFGGSNNLLEMFLKACDRCASQIACADPFLGCLTYRQLKRKVILAAEVIKEMPGEHIGILLPSTISAMVCVLATWLAGKIPVMINWTVGMRFVQQTLTTVDIKALITSERFLENMHRVELESIQALMHSLESFKKRLSWHQKAKALFFSSQMSLDLLKKLTSDQLSAERCAVVLFTSGTEKLPKAVPLTHANIMADMKGAAQRFPIATDDIFLSFLPPFHSFGFVVTGLFPLLMGIRAYYSPDPNRGAQLAQEIVTYRPTLLASAPLFLNNILHFMHPEQLASLRFIISGSDQMPSSLREKLCQWQKEHLLIEGYGLTECAPIVSMTSSQGLSGNNFHEKGVGLPISGVKLRIVDPHTYVERPQGMIGLSLINGANVFNGYLGTTEQPFLVIRNEKWLVTGDLGSLDQGGNLTLAGRQKRFIKMGGELLSLAAVEAAVEELTNFSGEKQVAIVSLAHDELRPSLYLFANYPIQLEKLHQALYHKGWNPLVKITGFQQLDPMPLTASGKHNYTLLEERARYLSL
jgi:long-chain-fatty-acid--[acyl-carrier-protein] ligase